MATNGLISITLKHNYHWEYVMGTAFDIKMSNVTFYWVHIDSILLNEIRCYDMDSKKQIQKNIKLNKCKQWGWKPLFFMKSHGTIFKTKIDYFWKQKKPDLSLYILKKCEFIIIAGLYPVSIRIKQKLEPLCLRSKPDDLAIDRAINHLGDIFH